MCECWLTSRFSDRRSQRASARADDVVKPVTHQTERFSAGWMQRMIRPAWLEVTRVHSGQNPLLSSFRIIRRKTFVAPTHNPTFTNYSDELRDRDIRIVEKIH